MAQSINTWKKLFPVDRQGDFYTTTS